jgi:uncharacterized protein YcnI
MHRPLMSIGLALLAAAVAADVASAHVTVWPQQTAPGAFEKYIVRVPTEKDIPTMRVELRFPSGLKVSAFQPKPGWTYEVEKDAAGNSTGVIWSGGRIAPSEFEEFAFLAANPQQPGQLVFQAYQTYQGGSVVTWDGPEGSDNPAPVTVVSAGSPAADNGSFTTSASGSGPTSTGAVSGRNANASSAPASSWLGIVAVVLALVALGVSGVSLRRRTA